MKHRKKLKFIYLFLARKYWAKKMKAYYFLDKYLKYKKI